jgi:hypothetical protein
MTDGLHAALDRLSAALLVLPVRLPPIQPTEVLLKKLGAETTVPRTPPIPELEAVRSRLREALEAGGPNAVLQPRDIKRAPWVLWQGDPPAVRFPGLLDRVLADAFGRPRVLYHLIEAWLRDFDADAHGIRATSLAIERMLHSRDDLRLAAWRRAHEEFALFDPGRGPSAFGRIILTSAQPVDALLSAVGFAEPSRAVSNYMRAVQAELLAGAKDLILGGGPVAHFDRLLDFLTREGSLRFPDARVSIAKALCQAWFAGGREPDAAFRDRTKDFLIRWLGNPQIRSWGDAVREAELIRRWLASASLKVFFEIIADHARDNQWVYREAFWSACLRKGAIDDAWLALGSDIHASARAKQSLGSAYGHLVGADSKDNAVLLLRVGQFVFAEWSHDGRLRAWPADRAPRFGRDRREDAYVNDKTELKRPSMRFSGPQYPDGGLRHDGAPTSLWQGRAAEFLKQNANISLTPMDWRPR